MKKYESSLEEFASNPVGKIRVIVDTMTTDSKKANRIMTVLANELTSDEINNFYKQLKLNI